MRYLRLCVLPLLLAALRYLCTYEEYLALVGRDE